VALKLLRPELSQDETFRRRFAHEARTAGGIRHRHLIPVVDAGELEGRSFLAAMFVDGRALEGILADEEALPIADAVRIVAQIGSALGALHRAGIVHRDVKPSNVIVDAAGSALLTDFGLAKSRAYTVLTKPGVVVGTLDYLAPEILRGAEATPASDVYALGCLAFECVVGRPPFGDRSMFDLANAHLNDAPSDPAAHRPDTPPALSWAILRALAKAPEQRPPTGTAFANLLVAGVRSAGPRADPEPS
jgi:serine/threonine-protein kinase